MCTIPVKTGVVFLALAATSSAVAFVSPMAMSKTVKNWLCVLT